MSSSPISDKVVRKVTFRKKIFNTTVEGTTSSRFCLTYTLDSPQSSLEIVSDTKDEYRRTVTGKVVAGCRS